MAVLTGIQGLNMGDGVGGKVALSIETRVLRILADSGLTWRFATSTNPESVKAGTATYYVPEIVQTKAYDPNGAAAYDPLQAGLRSFNLNERGMAKYEIESFDVSRLQNSEALLGQIALSLAMSIEATLNGHFWNNIKKEFDNTSGTLRLQKIELDKLGEQITYTKAESDAVFNDLLKLEYKITELSALFDKQHLGIDKADFYCILAPKCDATIRVAFRDQPSAIGEWQIAQTLVGRKIGNVRYIIDKMIGQNIAKNTSFSLDTDFNLQNIWGILVHNEAIAMPINFQGVYQLQNQDNANTRVIAKYQFGFGIIRPKLVYIITKTGQTITKTITAVKETTTKEAETKGEAA